MKLDRQTIITEIFLTVWFQPHLSNIDIVVAILGTLQPPPENCYGRPANTLKFGKEFRSQGGSALLAKGLRAPKFRTVI